jgi:DNA-binding NarL/FixJ family response regulator
MQQIFRVFLIAENRLLREALSRILSKRPELELVGAVPFSTDALQQILEADPEILVLDADPRLLGSFEFVRSVRRAAPNLRIVQIGMEEDAELFLRAVRAGVVGYVLKEASAMDVVAAVRAVAQEEAVCPPRLLHSLFHQVASEAAAVPSVRVRLDFGLTRREQQLVPMIARGLTNKEIAAQLNLSEQTIKNHVHRMLQKVGVSDRLSVVELLRDHGHQF